jgi:hypothetical protein
MLSSESFFRSPAAEQFFEKFLDLLHRYVRPPSEVIITEIGLTELLGVSKRHLAQLRAERKITYFKDKGKIFYLLSDVLEYLDRHRVDAQSSRNLFERSNLRRCS